MNLKTIATILIPFVAIHVVAQQSYPSPVCSTNETIVNGDFAPTWESLSKYEAPEWFRDAKFGIWAHWGPQCQPNNSDWYARSMYEEGSGTYNHHVANYGHPSQIGFKDIINEWKAGKWDPARLVSLYKRAGAKYFFAMANHHDNMDLWDSKYHRWNSVNLGPKRNIIAEWEKEARKNGLYFGVSVHAAHAWTFYEPAQKSDTKGSLAGVPYDGKLTLADGVGQWWEGYDPQELYAQNHPLSDPKGNCDNQWDWSHGAATPSVDYCNRFFDRTMQLINTYRPDLIYYDDYSLPLYPVSDAGLLLAAHLYNSSMQQNSGKMEAVLFGKRLTESEKECLTWDVERGAPPTLQDKPWQTCTCIGNWHYNMGIYNNNGYKSAQRVIRILADVVSKNGNLLLSIPIRGDGSIDEKEEAIVEEIASWMEINGEGIYGTRPWIIFGEGPAAETPIDMKNPQGFNEDNGYEYTAQDIRFTKKGDTLYAILMDWPQDNTVVIKSLSKGSKYYPTSIKEVSLISGEKLSHKRTKEGLKINLPLNKKSNMATIIAIR